MAITDKKISTIYSGRDISSLSDRPNQDGITASQLKARFDQLGKEIIPKINSLIDELFADLYSGTTQDGHTHNIDNLVDGITYKLFTAVERAKLALIAEGAEVNQNAFSNVKVGSTTIASTTKTDTFEIVEGLNIVMTVDALTKKITLNAVGDIGTEAVQSLLEDIGNYFTSLNVEGALQEVGAKLNPSSSKVTPIDADTLLLSDSADSSVFKKLTWANIKATLKAYFDTLYAVVDHVHSIYAKKPTNEATATSSQILTANGDGTSTFSNLGSVTEVYTDKTTPADNDRIILADSALSYYARRLTWSNLKTSLFSSPSLVTPTVSGSGRIISNDTSTGTAVYQIWSGTQAQYDAIGTKDDNTLYFIV